VKMSKNLWERDRKNLFRSIKREYQSEGYTQEEAKKLAKEEVDEIMEDKELFVNNLWKEKYQD